MPNNKIVDSEALGVYTQALASKINGKLSNIYIIHGSAIYADADYIVSPTKVDPSIDSVGIWQQINGVWTKITDVRAGWVFNISNEFTTDNNFLESAGVKPAAGTDLVVVNIGTEANPVYKYDLLATGISFDPAVIATKQDKVLSQEPEVTVPDLTYANAAARTADTTSNVSDGMIAFQEDTEEYYYAEVNSTTITWHDIGNTKTVEGAIILISSILPAKPISVAEIQAMFA